MTMRLVVRCENKAEKFGRDGVKYSNNDMQRFFIRLMKSTNLLIKMVFEILFIITGKLFTKCQI